MRASPLAAGPRRLARAGVKTKFTARVSSCKLTSAATSGRKLNTEECLRINHRLVPTGMPLAKIASVGDVWLAHERFATTPPALAAEKSQPLSVLNRYLP